MAQQEIEGFSRLFIRDVPMGAILNAKNADSFPIKECGAWVSNDNLYMIQEVDDNNYRLTPKSDSVLRQFYEKYAFVIGTIDDCVKAYNNLTNTPITKPPLGLMPRNIWLSQRVEEINAAVDRYTEAGKPIPEEWKHHFKEVIYLEVNELDNKMLDEAIARDSKEGGDSSSYGSEEDSN